MAIAWTPKTWVASADTGAAQRWCGPQVVVFAGVLVKNPGGLIAGLHVVLGRLSLKYGA